MDEMRSENSKVQEELRQRMQRREKEVAQRMDALRAESIKSQEAWQVPFVCVCLRVRVCVCVNCSCGKRLRRGWTRYALRASSHRKLGRYLVCVCVWVGGFVFACTCV